MAKESKVGTPKKESDIQLNILRYLRSQGLLFWRFSPDTYIPALGRYVKHEYVPNGLPDIMLLSKNKLVGLEVKKKSGRPSADQLLMKKRFELLGHEYHVVRSVDDVKEIL